MTPILSILALLGCDPYARASYGYAQPSYGYAQTYQYQAPYQAQTYFQADASTYAAAVAAQVKKDLAAAAALQAQQDLATRVAQLSQVVTQLAQQPPPPQPQPFQAPYQAPLPSPQQYQAPPVPAKSVPYSSPQVPTKQPAFETSQPYGVPPPPQVNPEGAEGFLPRMGLSYTGSDTSLASALTKCAQCHTGADAKRGVKIWEAPGQLADLNLEEKQLLFDAVAHKRMPPRTPVVDEQARRALATSINADLSAIASTLGGAGR
jgi:hypothetical protein